MSLFNSSTKKAVWALAKFLKMDSFMIQVLEALDSSVARVTRCDPSSFKKKRLQGLLTKPLGRCNFISSWKLGSEATAPSDTFNTTLNYLICFGVVPSPVTATTVARGVELSIGQSCFDSLLSGADHLTALELGFFFAKQG